MERLIQSSFRIKSKDLTVYIDPHRIPPGEEKANLILVTHEHSDHLDPSAIAVLQKRDTVIVANERCAEKLRGKGTVVTLKEGQTVTEKGVRVSAMPGYNRFHPRGLNVALLFTIGNQDIFHAGDTDRCPEWSSLGKVDIALLPIGGTFTMDEAEAAQAVKEIKPTVAIPMHYGYATGGDPQKFKRLVGDAARVEVLDSLVKSHLIVLYRAASAVLGAIMCLMSGRKKGRT